MYVVHSQDVSGIAITVTLCDPTSIRMELEDFVHTESHRQNLARDDAALKKIADWNGEEDLFLSIGKSAISASVEEL